MTVPPSGCSRWTPLLAALCLALCSACDKPPSTTRDPPPSLAEIPWPDLDQLAPEIAAQLRQQRLTLEALQQQSTGRSAELGQAYGAAGRLFHAYQLHTAAEGCYQYARALQPEMAEWRYYLGRLHATLGNSSAAATEFEAFLKLRPDDRPARLALGQALAEMGDTAGARAAFAKLLAEEEGAVAHFELGQLDAEGSDFAAAANHFERALALQPSASRLHLPLARAYRQLGREDDAEHHLAQRGNGPLQIEDPLIEQLGQLATGFRSFANRGVTAFRQRDYRAATAAFAKAVELEPDNANARQNLASALLLSGQPEPAEHHYREAIRLQPDLAQAHFNLGTLLAGKGDRAAAIEQLLQAVELVPSYRDAHFNLAKQLLDSRRWDDSHLHFERVLELDPGNAGAYLGTSRSLAGRGRWAEALRRLEKGRQTLAEDPRILISQTRLLAAAPDPLVRDGDRALALAEGLLRRQRTVPHLVIHAMALAELGRFEEAAAQQLAAIELAGATGAVPEHLPLSLDLYLADRPCREPWPGIG